MPAEKDSFSIRKTAKTNSPLSFNKLLKIKEDILGKKYELSLVFVGQTISRKLNKKYRKKNSPTNVLSFPIDKNYGEIFIDLRTAKKEAGSFKMVYRNFVLYLFIHASLHLKGLEHSSRMKREEEKFLAKYSS